MFFELEALRGLAPGAWQTSLGPVAASLFWVRSPGGPLECERVGVLCWTPRRRGRSLARGISSGRTPSTRSSACAREAEGRPPSSSAAPSRSRGAGTTPSSPPSLASPAFRVAASDRRRGSPSPSISSRSRSIRRGREERSCSSPVGGDARPGVARVTLLDLQASEHLEPVLLHDRRIAPAVRAIHERPSRPGASARLPTCAPYPARPLQPAFAGSPATRRSATSLAAGSPAPPDSSGPATSGSRGSRASPATNPSSRSAAPSNVPSGLRPGSIATATTGRPRWTTSCLSAARTDRWVKPQASP